MTKTDIIQYLLSKLQPLPCPPEGTEYDTDQCREYRVHVGGCRKCWEQFLNGVDDDTKRISRLSQKAVHRG